jgi:hypothetical protein
VQAAHAAARKQDTYLAAQYRRLASRRGKSRAAVAVGHTLLVISYHVIKDGTAYQELGGAVLRRTGARRGGEAVGAAARTVGLSSDPRGGKRRIKAGPPLPERATLAARRCAEVSRAIWAARRSARIGSEHLFAAGINTGIFRPGCLLSGTGLVGRDVRSCRLDTFNRATYYLLFDTRFLREYLHPWIIVDPKGELCGVHSSPAAYSDLVIPFFMKVLRNP